MTTEKPEAQMPTIKLPAHHARDWKARCEAAEDAEVIAETARTITLALTDAALCDLISDALYYSEEMGPLHTEDIDYRGPARTCLRAIEKAGIRWTRRPGTFSITLA